MAKRDLGEGCVALDDILVKGTERFRSTNAGGSDELLRLQRERVTAVPPGDEQSGALRHHPVAAVLVPGVIRQRTTDVFVTELSAPSSRTAEPRGYELRDARTHGREVD